MIEVSVLIYVFRRPDLTIQSLSKLKEYGVKNIFIACDGPREIAEEQALVSRTRQIIESFDFGDSKVEKLFFDKNMGINNVAKIACPWLFSKVEYAVIHEEDVFPDKSFYLFCEDLLEKYKNDNRVKLITGFNFLPEKVSGEDDYFFTNLPAFWGIATWRRFWDQMDWDLIHKHTPADTTRIINTVVTDKRHVAFFENIFNYWRNGSEIGGDQRIFYNIWSLNGLSIVPTYNLIRNKGIGTEGANSKNIRKELLELGKNVVHSVQLKRHPAEFVINKKYDQMVMSKIFAPKLSIITRVRNKLARILAAYKKRV